MIAFRQSEGWQLYNSAEGYPYYFNDLSGVSEWATDGTYYLTIENEQSGEYNDAKTEEINEGTRSLFIDHNVREDEESDDEEEDEEEDEESGASSFDEATERKFKQYLRTPEGIAAVLEEQERIVKYIEAKDQRNQHKREEQYLKTLLQSKKYDGDKSKTGSEKSSVLMTTLQGAWFWLTEKPNGNSTDTVATNASTLASGSRNRSEKRPSKRRSVHEEDEGDAEAGMGTGADDGNQDEDSDEDSLSSDDSDVEVIKAPLFADLPAWMQWNFWRERVVNPSQQFLQQTVFNSTVVREENSPSNMSSSQNAALMQSVSNTTWAFAVQAATMTGQVSYTVAESIFTRMQPYLVHFMENIIDSHHVQTTRQRLQEQQLISGDLQVSQRPPQQSAVSSHPSTNGRVSPVMAAASMSSISSFSHHVMNQHYPTPQTHHPHKSKYAASMHTTLTTGHASSSSISVPQVSSEYYVAQSTAVIDAHDTNSVGREAAIETSRVNGEGRQQMLGAGVRSAVSFVPVERQVDAEGQIEDDDETTVPRITVLTSLALPGPITRNAPISADTVIQTPRDGTLGENAETGDLCAELQLNQMESDETSSRIDSFFSGIIEGDDRERNEEDVGSCTKESDMNSVTAESAL